MSIVAGFYRFLSCVCTCTYQHIHTHIGSCSVEKSSSAGPSTEGKHTLYIHVCTTYTYWVCYITVGFVCVGLFAPRSPAVHNQSHWINKKWSRTRSVWCAVQQCGTFGSVQKYIYNIKKCSYNAYVYVHCSIASWLLNVVIFCRSVQLVSSSWITVSWTPSSPPPPRRLPLSMVETSSTTQQRQRLDLSPVSSSLPGQLCM